MAPIKFYITDRSKAIHRLLFKLLYVLVFDFCDVCTICTFSLQHSQNQRNGRSGGLPQI